MATKQMLEFRACSAIVTLDNKPRGILTSNDILTRVIARDIPAESTLVGKVMTPNPECSTIDTPIVDALHTMHDGKFLYLPVVDRAKESIYEDKDQDKVASIWYSDPPMGELNRPPVSD